MAAAVVGFTLPPVAETIPLPPTGISWANADDTGARHTLARAHRGTAVARNARLVDVLREDVMRFMI